MPGSGRIPRVPRVARPSAPAEGQQGDAEEARVRLGRGTKVTALGAAARGSDDSQPRTGADAPGTSEDSQARPAGDSPSVREDRETPSSRGRPRLGAWGTGRPARKPSSASPVAPREPGRDEAPGGRGAAGATADVLVFPEPPRRRRRRSALTAAIVALVLVAGLMALVLFTPLIAVRSVVVQGTHLLSVQQVEAALAPVMGRPLAQVGDDQVRSLVSPLVQVKAVSARAVPPDTLVVTVTERVPVALVKSEGKLLVVDGDGVVLGEASDTSQYPVPVIDGAAMPLGQEVFKAVTAVLAALPADVLGQLATATAQSVDSVELRLTDGRSVVWGNAQERELKARVLAALMKAAENPQKGQAPARVFDVSAPRHPVTR
ncbi:cell division protein FtsQ/DivIB [Sinomonas atrocyanea]|uniref:cell division protein FtsQ/DivIB n=1 Tax=Sinomonas atrocyanea TaxID=37927 RepID=UPI003D980991